MSKKPLKKIICTNNPKQEYGRLQKRQTEKKPSALREEVQKAASEQKNGISEEFFGMATSH